MAQLRDGEITSFEVIVKYVTAELAYTVWIERQQARLGGRQDITPFYLRVTMIFRPEDGKWKIVHLGARRRRRGPVGSRTVFRTARPTVPTLCRYPSGFPRIV